MSTLEDRLRMAEIEVYRLRALISKQKQDPYPVGTVLQGYGHGNSLAFVLRVDSVHQDFAVPGRPKSNAPVWTIIWSDFSGGTYTSFGELKERFAHIDWQELYVPGKGKR